MWQPVSATEASSSVRAVRVGRVGRVGLCGVSWSRVLEDWRAMRDFQEPRRRGSGRLIAAVRLAKQEELSCGRVGCGVKKRGGVETGL